MNKYICEGSLIRNVKTGRAGKVIATDPVSRFAIVQDNRGYRTELFKNIEVTSYKEVE